MTLTFQTNFTFSIDDETFRFGQINYNVESDPSSGLTPVSSYTFFVFKVLTCQLVGVRRFIPQLPSQAEINAAWQGRIRDDHVYLVS